METQTRKILKKLWKGLGFWFLSGLLLMPAAGAETVDKIVAVVNQEAITLYDLDLAVSNINRNMQKLPEDQKKAFAGADLRKEALQTLIDQSLINQEMEKRGITVSEQEITNAVESVLKRNNLTLQALQKELAAKGESYQDYRNDIASQLKRFRFIAQTVGSKVKVSDDDVEAFFAQNMGKVKDIQEIHIAQVVIPLSPTASDSDFKAAQGKAQELYQKAKGGGNFEQLMNQYGGEGSGDLGKVAFSSLSPQLVAPLQDLEAGQVTEPIRTQAGFIVIKLLEKPQVALKGTDQMKADIHDKIYEMKVQEEMKRYVDQLKSKAFIDIRS